MRSTGLIFGLFFVVCLALTPPGAANAQGASISLGVSAYDASSPVEITSASLELDQTNGSAIFTGDVIVVQGGMTMTCDRMVVTYGTNARTGENEIRTIRMFGGVTFVGPADAAESQSAVYSLTSASLVMSGNVLVTQGPTAMSSDRLIYNLTSGTGRLEGNVKTILQGIAN